jgi:signal recognition particle receptor subunit beta
MAREINCKIVYYGPGLCGKTTNLQYIYERTNPDAKGKMISLATETDRTLFFDFLPLALGEIRGFKTRFSPLHGAGAGLLRRQPQAHLEGRRRRGLRGRLADRRIEANQESVENLRTNLAEQGYNLDKLPYVIQYNKRDCPTSRRSKSCASCSTRRNVPDFEAVARTGVGVFDTLKAVAKLVLTELKKGGP